MQGVRGVNAGSVACRAAARVLAHGTGRRGRGPASGQCHPNYYQLSQTVANYRSCLRFHWLPRGPARRAIARECLLGMQKDVCSRGVPRGSTLVLSLSALARHGCHAPPAAECHTYMQGVRGANAGSVACRTAARVLAHGTGGRGMGPASGQCHPNYYQLSQTIANYRSCLRFHWLPRGPARRAIGREYLLGMQKYVCSRGVPRRSTLVLSLSALARHGCHAPPAAECHTYMQGVRGVDAGSVACRAAARVLAHGTGGRGRWPASGQCHPNYYQLSQTIANYRSCLRFHWLPRVPARRAIARECLLGMHQYVCSRGVPRGSTLVLSLSALARHGCHAPPAAECHTYMQGVRGVHDGSVSCRAAARVLAHGTGGRGMGPASGQCHPNHYQLSRTIANYRSCLWFHWLPRGPARRAIGRECLLGMQQYVCSRSVPRGSTLGLSLSALARHGCHAPPAAECHTYMQGVRGVDAGSVECRAAARVLAHGTGGRGRWPASGQCSPNYYQLSQTIANYRSCLRFHGSPGALHAAPSRANVSWGCSNTFAAVVCHAGARWCCPFPHWHAMDATPHRRQNVTRTCRASEVSMPALSRVG